MRCFIAVELDPRLAGILGELANGLSHVEGLKAASPQNMHLTLKFLGDVGEVDVDALSGELSKLEFKKFAYAASGVGAFPSRNKPKVIWAGVSEGADRMVLMQKALDERLEKLGFERDDRFHPHITLARVKQDPGPGKLEWFFNKYGGSAFGEYIAEKASLYESRLASGGPQYRLLSTRSLI